MKYKSKYIKTSLIHKRFKNSKVFTNVKTVGEDGLLELKNGYYASLIELKAVDLSLSSNQEKTNFFHYLKTLYQIKNLNLKCFKLDEKINLNNNKLYLKTKVKSIDVIIDKNKHDLKRLLLLKENIHLIEDLENNNFTVSSIYYLVVIAKDTNELERQLDEIEDLFANIQPKLNIEIITNRLEVFKFLSNLYLCENPLDILMLYNYYY